LVGADKNVHYGSRWEGGAGDTSNWLAEIPSSLNQSGGSRKEKMAEKCTTWQKALREEVPRCERPHSSDLGGVTLKEGKGWEMGIKVLLP